MKKILSIFAAALVAVAVNAEPVVLPATLDVTNVSFRSEGMPDFVLDEGDYAGTYFDMGAHDSANDTLLYAEWDVTIEPIKYDIDVVVYNTNSWRVQLYVLNQAGDTVKDLRYKGSSGQKGKYAIGSIDMSDLAAGNYKVRAHAATAWSAMKLKEVIFKADYKGVTVDLPGKLLPAYAELSANASVTDDAIAFKPSTAPDEYANWNVSFAAAGEYKVSIDITASNGHNYGVELIGEDEETSYGAVNEGGQKGDTGVKELGTITVPAAGKYIVHLTNAIQWSEAVLNSITFAAPAPEHTYTVAGDNTDLFGTSWDPTNATNDMVLQEDKTYKWEKTDLTLPIGSIAFKVVKDHNWDNGAYPKDNYILNIAEAGIYTIDIYYNPNDNDYVGAVATKTGDAVVIPTVAMHGNFTGSWGDTENFAIAEGNATASLKLNIAAGSYEFGMRIGGSGNWTSNGVAFTRENNSAEVVAGSGNLTLAADEAGEYIFTWTYETNTLTITFPEAAAQVQLWKVSAETPAAANSILIDDDMLQLASVYTSFISGTNHTYGEELFAKAFQVRAKNAPSAQYPVGEENVVTDDTKKASPLVLTAKKDIDVTFYYRQQQTAETPAAENDNKDLWIYDQAAIDTKLTGTHTSVDVSGDSKYAFVTKKMSFEKGHVYTLTAVGTTLPLFGMEYEAAEGGPTTALINTNASEKAVKVIENGQLIIIKNGVRYNVMGMTVK